MLADYTGEHAEEADVIGLVWQHLLLHHLVLPTAPSPCRAHQALARQPTGGTERALAVLCQAHHAPGLS